MGLNTFWMHCMCSTRVMCIVHGFVVQPVGFLMTVDQWIGQSHLCYDYSLHLPPIILCIYLVELFSCFLLLSMDGAFWSLLASLLSTNSITCFYVLQPIFLSLFLFLPHPFFQVDSVDNFTPSNTPSRGEDSKSQLKSRSRSPSMASDVEPIEVNSNLWTLNLQLVLCLILDCC
jgi:hypothetical protein